MFRASRVLCASLLSAAAVFSCAPAVTAGYLGNADQKAALLSPVPLGPAMTLEKTPAEAQAAKKAEAATPQAQPTAKPRRAVAQPRKPRTNPLDSFARDTQPRAKNRAAKSPARQTWPCTGGGICAWTTPR